MGTFKTENPGNQPVWVNTSTVKHVIFVYQYVVQVYLV